VARGAVARFGVSDPRHSAGDLRQTSVELLFVTLWSRGWRRPGGREHHPCRKRPSPPAAAGGLGQDCGYPFGWVTRTRWGPSCPTARSRRPGWADLSANTEASRVRSRGTILERVDCQLARGYSGKERLTRRYSYTYSGLADTLRHLRTISPSWRQSSSKEKFCERNRVYPGR